MSGVFRRTAAFGANGDMTIAATDAAPVAPVNTYYSQEALKNLAETNKSFLNGYITLFDIKDSTKRKREDSQRWFSQTQAFYRGIMSLVNRISGIDGIFGDIDPEYQQGVVKFIGDSGMIFFPHSYSSRPDDDQRPSPDISRSLFQHALSFRSDTHNISDFGGLRLKSVVTYVTHIRPVILSDEKSKLSDVLGRGIDFTFRLEKFAGDTHIIVNSMMFDSLCAYSASKDQQYPKLSINKIPHGFIKCVKKLKGWDAPGGETFYLVMPEGDEILYRPIPSPERDDVEAEMALYFLSNNGSNSATSPKRGRNDAIGSLTSPDTGESQ